MRVRELRFHFLFRVGPEPQSEPSCRRPLMKNVRTGTIGKVQVSREADVRGLQGTPAVKRIRKDQVLSDSHVGPDVIVLGYPPPRSTSSSLTDDRWNRRIRVIKI